MANYVLVHGAWHGAWCYRETASILRSAGHTVVTPTHTGVGDRAHQSSESITLETHVRDVAACIEAEELEDVILCGHSYGGMVITQLADRITKKIKALVYLDAFVPTHGESVIDLLRASLDRETAGQFIDGFRGSAQVNGSGMMDPIPAEIFGILEKNRAWVERRCVPQALATFEMPVLLENPGFPIDRNVYILANNWDPSPFRYFAEKFKNETGWELIIMPSSHDVMVDMPVELAAELEKLAS